MDLKQLYKSNSYKNMQQAYVGSRRRGGRGGALAHLELVEGPGAMRKPPRDYLSEFRDRRVAREAKTSNAGKVRKLIKNEKLSTVEKLNLVKAQADQIERDALESERLRAAEQHTRAHAED